MNMSDPTLALPNIAWKDLLKSLAQQKCILLIGPDLLPSENLFLELCRHTGIDPDDLTGTLPRDISMVYPKDELFLFPNDAARTRVWRKFDDFHDEWLARVTPIYEQIAALPFPVVISTLPDLGLRKVFERRGILHQFSYYDYRGVPEPHDRISVPPRDVRLIFNMFGVLSDHNSLVLTHDDLFQYFCQILGDRKLGSELYIELSHALMLLRLLNPDRNKGRQYALNPAAAEETRVFFADQFEVEFVDGVTPLGFLETLSEKWTTEEQSRLGSGAPIQQTLRDWLRQGQLARILERLRQTALAKDADFQLGRLNSLREAIRNGVASSEAAFLEMNKIRLAVQDLIEKTDAA
jgi:hypothetical protein